MMIATKTFPWGSVEVRFEVDDSTDSRTALLILAANTSIQKTLDMLATLTTPPKPPSAESTGQ
jgi:hypothetical protein